MPKWRTKAKEIQRQAVEDARREGVRGRALRRWVNGYYEKYAARRWKFPYRVWLDELNDLMAMELSGCEQGKLSLEF